MKAINAIAAFVLLTAFAASAQSITITKANMPAAGDAYIYSTTTDNVDVSATGANHTWDFSKLTPISQDTMKFKKPQDVSPAYLLSFYGDLAVQQPNSGVKDYYGFFKVNNNGYAQVGAGFTMPVLNIPLPLQYTSPDIVYRFPLTFGNKTDSSIYELSTSIQSINIAIHGKRVNTVDGYGKITTPYKSYSCIRIKSVITEYDTLGFIPVDNSRTEYKWLSTDEKTPVMQVVESPVLGTTVIYRDMHRDIVNPNAPQVDFSADRTVVKIGDTVVFTNNTTPPLAQWAWSISPSSFTYVKGTKASAKNPAVVFTQAGQYSVSLSATNPLGSNSTDKPNYITVNTGTGIALTSQPGVNGTIIYPNPAKDYVFISSGPLADKTTLQWHIYDATGRSIADGSAQYSERTKIDVTNCPAGLYYIQLNSSIWGKIVIEK